MARSNRQLTQFAVNKVREFLQKGPEGFTAETSGNTRVYYDACDHCPRQALKVDLFGKTILTMVTSPLERRSIGAIFVETGDFYDSKGRPSRTTRERLNGLLDALGEFKFFPEGLRVFLSEDDCHLGRGEASKPFNREQPVRAMLAHPSDLVFG